MDRQKICPKCRSVVPIDSQLCNCGHRFTTQFVNPNQTQAFTPPTQQSPQQSTNPTQLVPANFAQPALPYVVPAYPKPPLAHRWAWFWYRRGNLVILSCLGLGVVASAVIWLRAISPPPFVGIWSAPSSADNRVFSFGTDHTGSISSSEFPTSTFVWKQDGSFLLLTASGSALPTLHNQGFAKSLPLAWTASDSGTVLTLTGGNDTEMFYRRGAMRP